MEEIVDSESEKYFHKSPLAGVSGILCRLLYGHTAACSTLLWSTRLETVTSSNTIYTTANSICIQ